jgi:hypothetical protein
MALRTTGSNPAIATGVPADWLEGLHPGLKARVLSPDEATSAEAMLDVVDTLPAFSSSVAQASGWLGAVRALVARMADDCPERVELRMLASIARMAFAAREISPGLAASEAALARAAEMGDLDMQVAILAQRVPFLAYHAPVPTSRDVRAMDALLTQLPPSLTPGHRDGDVALARIAWAGATGDQARLRKELANFGRLKLPEDDRLAFCAFETTLALVQWCLRAGQRGQAASALIYAAQLADAHDAISELANVQTVVAALAVQAGDFHAAVAHAQSAIANAGACRHVHPDPWLGLPIDICQARDPGAAVQQLADAVLRAQDVGDATGFLVAATAMAAFYLADQRAMEAMDGLNEAAEVAKSLDDVTIAPAIRGVAESLLRHLGILTA